MNTVTVSPKIIECMKAEGFTVTNTNDLRDRNKPCLVFDKPGSFSICVKDGLKIEVKAWNDIKQVWATTMEIKMPSCKVMVWVLLMLAAGVLGKDSYYKYCAQ